MMQFMSRRLAKNLFMFCQAAEAGVKSIGIIYYLIIAIFLTWVFGPSLAVGYLYHDDYLITQVTSTGSCMNHPQFLYYLVDVFRPGAIAIKCIIGVLSPKIEQLVFFKYVSLTLCFAILVLFFNEARKLVPNQFWALALTLFLSVLPSYQQPILNLANSTHLIAWLLSFSAGVVFVNYCQSAVLRISYILSFCLTLLFLYCATATYPMSSFAFFIPICVQLLRSKSIFEIAKLASLATAIISAVFATYLITKSLAFNSFSYLLNNPTNVNPSLDLSSIVNFYINASPSWYLAIFNYQPLEAQFVHGIVWMFCALVLIFIFMSVFKTDSWRIAALRLTKILVVSAVLLFSLFPVAVTGYFLLFRLFIVFHAMLILFVGYVVTNVVVDIQLLCQEMSKLFFLKKVVAALKTPLRALVCFCLLVFGANWQQSILHEVAIPNWVEYQKVLKAVKHQLNQHESIHVITGQRSDKDQ